MPDIPLVRNITTEIDLVLIFSQTYIPGLTYTVSVKIWNLVRECILNVTFEIQVQLPDLNFTVYDFDNDTGIQKAGGGPNNDYFALEHFVMFSVSLDNGTGLSFDWDFGDGNSNRVNETLTVYHKYNAVGSYTVSLTTSNGASSVANTSIIFIHKGCFDIAISSNSPRHKNTTFDFSIYPGSIATDACYMIDFGDDNASPSRYQFLGDFTYCSTIPEWSPLLTLLISSFINLTSGDWESRMNSFSTHTSTMTPPAKVTALNSSIFVSSTTTLIPATSTAYSIFVPTPESAFWNETVSSVMPNPGLYDTSLQCINRVSNVTVTWATGVTKGPCWWPDVNLTIVNECYSPFCDTVYPAMRTSYRSERLVVYSYVRINYTSTKVAYYWWRVFKQLNDPMDGSSNETEITDLGNAEVYSLGARNLILEPRSLEVGNVLCNFINGEDE